MLARHAEDGPGGNALGKVTNTLEVLGHHKDLGEVAGRGLTLADLGHELFRHVPVDEVDGGVVLNDLLGRGNVVDVLQKASMAFSTIAGGGETSGASDALVLEANEQLLDVLGWAVGHLGELAGELGRGLIGNL